jgi:transcriptional regulator with XRE-family HTH domain
MITVGWLDLRVLAGIVSVMTVVPEQASPVVGWTVDDSTFGARLALIRRRMDWNVKQAARECGQSAASWRAWELHDARPRDYLDVCRMIAERTGCDRWWLLTGERQATPNRATAKYPIAIDWITPFGLPARPRDNRPTGRPRTGELRPVPGRTARVARHPFGQQAA